MDVGGGNPGMDKRFEQNIEFGCGILMNIEYWEEPIVSACWWWKPSMDKRFGQNIEFGYGVLIQSRVLGGANREWMLVVEIRV